MIVEQRQYTIKIGSAPLYFSNYEQLGLAVQRRILGNLAGYYVTEVGSLNLIVHQWAYESMGEREQRREKLGNDPDWKAYLAKSREAGLVHKQENLIMKPAPFFEPMLRAMLAAAQKG
jgi:hypothetical protein